MRSFWSELYRRSARNAAKLTNPPPRSKPIRKPGRRAFPLLLEELEDRTLLNVAPVLAANTGLRLDEGAAATITTTNLKATDPDSPTTAVFFQLSTAPVNGTVRLSGTALGLNGSFTEADIEAGRV